VVSPVSDQIVYLVLHLVLYGIPVLLIARFKSERVYFFYAYFGFLYVFTQVFAVLYSLKIADDLTITGGNIAYSSLILITMVVFFMTRDAAVVRNLIVFQALMNVFLYFLYLILSAVLNDPATLNIFAVDPALFSTTIAVNIISTCVFVVETMVMFIALESAKRVTNRPILLLPLAIIVFIGVLILDGFLFPFLVQFFIPVFGQFIVGGIIGKLILGIGFAPFILLFAIFFKGTFKRYTQSTIRVKEMLLPTGDRLRKRLSETRSKLIESEKNYLVAYKEATLYKDMFTHDITNIVQVITLNLRLHEQTGEKVTERVLQDIKVQVDKAVKLIENVRKTTQIQDRLVGLEVKDVEATLHAAVEDAKNEYQDKVEIEIHAGEDIVKVRANELLGDIFHNIISNAVRYNESKVPRIDINVSTEKGGITMDKVRIEFVDNGIGVSDDRKTVIFQEGHQDKKGGKGMGLGLSLIAKALDLFGGDIHVEDRVPGEPSRGCNFVIRLPKYHE
jgi:signal transduction histidine kinase